MEKIKLIIHKYTIITKIFDYRFKCQATGYDPTVLELLGMAGAGVYVLVRSVHMLTAN